LRNQNLQKYLIFMSCKMLLPGILVCLKVQDKGIDSIQN